jgi:hypothetical protein
VSLGVSLLIHAFSASKDDLPSGGFEAGRRSASNLLALVVLVGVAKTFIDIQYVWSPIVKWVVAFFVGLILSIPVYLLGAGLGMFWKAIRVLAREQSADNTAKAVKDLTKKLHEQGVSQEELNAVVSEIREEAGRKIILQLSLKVNDTEAKSLAKLAKQSSSSQEGKDLLNWLCQKYFGRSTDEYVPELVNAISKKHFEKLLARKLKAKKK